MRYISVLEYLQSRAKMSDLPPEQVANLNTIVPRANELLETFGEYRGVNSGYRRLEDHLRIYKEKARKARVPFDVSKVPMGSGHLTCRAIDLEDKDGRLYKFCKNNIPLLEKIGLWCEERQGGWLHCQIFKPRSGKRFFNP